MQRSAYILLWQLKYT